MFSFFLLTLAATVRAENQLLPGSCDFESNTCGYTSDADFLSWTLNKDGRFVTVEPEYQQDAGSTQHNENRGILMSPLLDYEGWSCLRLVYQIAESGSLQVFRRTEGKSFDRPLWISHTASDSWVISSMDLHNTSERYKVVIEGVPGDRAGSSVAIFEIHISPGYCLECDFEESHLCGYNNQWNTNVNWYIGGGMAQPLRGNMPNDHTYNNSTGHFMYVDSIYSQTFTEVAKLLSPMTTVPMWGCLSFQYQNGMQRGNLFSVFTRDLLGHYEELWRVSPEDHNNWATPTRQWALVQMDVKAPYPIQLVFEVAFNSPRGGRVSVDDISFSPEFCNADTEPTFDPSIANCDFESGVCNYTQDYTTGSPWKRVSIKPNIFRNGDHTTGEGFFLLAHSQLNPRSGYVSRLFSPTLPGNMKYCLRFYFSLRGFFQTDQALDVYLKYPNSSQERIWTQAEKSRGIWMAIDITLQTSQPAKVMFVSTCQSLWDCGSVALDDITVNLGDCELMAGMLLSLPGRCDFEAGRCGYTQDKRGSWVWRRGPTPTSYTGPRGDHTTGLGYYMHIEASPMLPGQSALLHSRPLRGSRGPQCLRFYYHMYGSGAGRLTVILDRNGNNVLLWQRSGDHSIAWLRATVEYQCDLQHQIVFEATRGSSVRSDIAIDDISFESGPCPDIENESSHGSGHSNEIE